MSDESRDGEDRAGETSAGPTGPARPGAARMLKGMAALLLAVGGVGVAYYAIAHFDEPPLPINPPGPAATIAQAKAEDPGPAASEPSPTRTRLRIWKTGGPSGRPLVALDAPDEAPSGPDTTVRAGQAPRQARSRGLLSRELVRQAVLLAARRGLGASTRDAVLGESPPRRPADLTLIVEDEFPRGRPSTLVIRREGGAALYQAELLPASPTVRPDLPRLAETMERLASGPLVEAIYKEGLDPAGKAPERPAEWPSGVEGRIATMSASAQMAALRQLSAAERSGAMTVALEGGLARGYSNLAVLTEHLWHPAHRVYAARGLLHGRASERLAGAKSPDGLRALAYAEALAGRPADALAHLDLAAKIPGGGEPPSWLGSIAAFCRHDRRAMEGVEGLAAPLARLLNVLSAEVSSGTDNDVSDASTAEVLRAAREAIRAEPECFRAYDTACRFGGVSAQHGATSVALGEFERTIGERARSLPRLPAPLGEGDPVLALASAEAGDDAEPGVGAMASYIREARFVLVWRRLHFVTFLLAAPDDEYATANRRLVADHPLLPFLDAHVRGFDNAEFAGLGTSLAKTDIEITALPLMARVQDALVPISATVRQTNDTQGRWLRDVGLMHGDDTTRDLAAWIRSRLDWAVVDSARRLLEIDPVSPLARASLIERDPALDAALVGRWEREPEAAPAVLAALGRRYVAARRWDDAARVFARAIERSPDRATYRALADAYKVQGQTAKWRETLDAFLRQPEEYGLDHARVRNEIAQALMGEGRFREALPYADAAAESWAAWAMLTASACHEALQQWDEAELWIHRVSERYPANGADWFFWCKRTGHGDSDAALAVASHLLDAAGRLYRDADTAMGYTALLMLAGREPQALEIAKSAQAAYPHPVLALRLAVLADAAGDAPLRDRSLASIADDPATKGPVTAKTCGLIRDWLSRPDADQTGPDLAALDALFAQMKQSHSEVGYPVGRFLERHGQKGVAAEFYALSYRKAASPIMKTRALAREALVRLGLDPETAPARSLPTP